MAVEGVALPSTLLAAKSTIPPGRRAGEGWSGAWDRGKWGGIEELGLLYGFLPFATLQLVRD